jgi:hypothetical protein
MASNRVIPHSDTKGKALPSTASIRRVAQLTQHLAPVTETEQVNTRPTLPIDYPVSRLQLDANKHIDDIRPLKVAVIGVCILHVTSGRKISTNSRRPVWRVSMLVSYFLLRFLASS